MLGAVFGRYPYAAHSFLSLTTAARRKAKARGPSLDHRGGRADGVRFSRTQRVYRDQATVRYRSAMHNLEGPLHSRVRLPITQTCRTQRARCRRHEVLELGVTFPRLQHFLSLALSCPPHLWRPRKHEPIPSRPKPNVAFREATDRLKSVPATTSTDLNHITMNSPAPLPPT